MQIERSVEVDKISFEVIRHKLMAITEELAITLKSVSGSPIVSEACDYNIGLYLEDGSIVTMGKTELHQTGSMSKVIGHVIKECKDDPGIEEGDMFIVNNPYQGALHPSDVSIVAPIFYEGEMIAWSGASAHELDVGGMDFGSWCPKATEIQQECMILPPLKIVKSGKIQKDVWNAIMSMTRLPFIVGLDFKAMIAANNVARKRFAQLIERYGIVEVKSVMNGLIDMSENLFRARLMELPDGQYRSENFLDHDGHTNKLYRVSLTVTKKGDSLTFDMTGTSRQAPGFINSTEAGLIGAIFSGLSPILAYDIPWNEGLLKLVKVITPSGVLCNAEWPAPVGSATCAAIWVIENAVVEAISKLVGCHEKYRQEGQGVPDGSFATLNLGGLNQYGEPFGTMFLDPIAGGGGAFSNKDGVDADGCHCIPAQNIANVETNENFAPILYLYRSLIKDSGGIGKNQGGRSVGMAFIPHKVDFLEGLLVTHGVESPNSVGIFGGYPGSCNVNTLVKNSNIRELFAQGVVAINTEEIKGESVDLGAKPGRIPLKTGDILEYTWQGGGGYGDPLDREPSKVMADLAEGAISETLASTHYGVVYSNGVLDQNSTLANRKMLRRQRTQKPKNKDFIKGNAKAEKRLVPMGNSLYLAELDNMIAVMCNCGFAIAPANENWKDYATVSVIIAESCGTLIKLHEDLEAREYACPNCGQLHSVEVTLKNSPPLWDIEIDLEQFFRNKAMK